MKTLIVLLLCVFGLLCITNSAQASLIYIGDQPGINWCYDSDSVRIKNEDIGQCYYVTVCWSYDQPQIMQEIEVKRLFLHMVLNENRYTILFVTVNSESGGMEEPITLSDDVLVWEPIQESPLLQQTQLLIRKSIVYVTQ